MNPYRLSPEAQLVLGRGETASLTELSSILAKVEQVHTRAVGFAGNETDTYRAFRLLLERGDASLAAFREILENGTPAARFYAVEGLRRLGLLTLDAEINYFSGCLMSKLKVQDLARICRI